MAPSLLFADCDTRAASSPIPGSFSLFFVRLLCAAKEKRETWARGKITGAPRRASTYATGYQNILSTNVSLVIDNSFSPCTSHFHSTTGRADQSPLSYYVGLVVPEAHEIMQLSLNGQNEREDLSVQEFYNNTYSETFGNQFHRAFRLLFLDDPFRYISSLFLFISFYFHFTLNKIYFLNSFC